MIASGLRGATIDPAALRIGPWVGDKLTGALAAQIERTLRLISAPGEVVEIRALECNPRGRWSETQSGLYDADHLADAARAAANLVTRGQARAVYFALNPVKPDLLARAANRTRATKEDEAIGDSEVERRRLLLVDVDAKGPAGISGTDAEHAAALVRCQAVRNWLAAQDWPAPVRADSGNGSHLLYRIELPNDGKDGPSAKLVSNCLRALAARFDDDIVKVDTSVFNASRICKLYGTPARKGDSTVERPHRLAELLDVPDPWVVVPKASLEALAALAPIEPTRNGSNGKHHPNGVAAECDLSGWSIDERRKRADKYLDSVPGAEAGNNGHNATYKTARLLREFGLAGDDALPSFMRWNEKCQPPWKEAELLRKLSEADKAGGPLGGKLDDKRPSKGRAKKFGSQSAAVCRPQASSESTDRKVVTKDPETPTADVYATITDHLMGAGGCYRSAGKLVRIGDGLNMRIVAAPEELAGLLASLEIEFEHVRHGKEGDSSEFVPLPKSYAQTYLHNARALRPFDEILTFSRAPLFDKEFILSRPGYNAHSKLFYAGEPIKPTEATARLDALLREFPFAEPADRANYLALMLTPLFAHLFPGEHPGGIFNANQTEVGKTALAQLIGCTHDGEAASTISFNVNDEEMEKRFCADFRTGKRIFMIDNAKTTRKAPVIQSALLERFVTDSINSARLLGTNNVITALNSHLLLFTINDGRFSRDLIGRCVAINLFVEGPANKRQFTIADPKTYAVEHRAELLGELVGMVERWKAAGRPLVPQDCRFRPWAALVGGILQTNGIEGFLQNAQTSATAFDPVADSMTQLCMHCSGRLECTTDQILAEVDALKLFRAEVGGGPAASR